MRYSHENYTTWLFGRGAAQAHTLRHFSPHPAIDQQNIETRLKHLEFRFRLHIIERVVQMAIFLLLSAAP